MANGTVFVVVHAELDFQSPARYGETLVIGTVVSDVSRAAFTFSHVVREQKSGRIIVEGSARLAVTDGTGKVKRLDKGIVAVLHSHSTRGLNG
jgi:acyl-CoA thioester hydrolase